MIEEFSFNVTIYYPTIKFALYWITCGVMLSPITVARLWQDNRRAFMSKNRLRNRNIIILLSLFMPILSLVLIPQLVIQYRIIKGD